MWSPPPPFFFNFDMTDEKTKDLICVKTEWTIKASQFLSRIIVMVKLKIWGRVRWPFLFCISTMLWQHAQNINKRNIIISHATSNIQLGQPTDDFLKKKTRHRNRGTKLQHHKIITIKKKKVWGWWWQTDGLLLQYTTSRWRQTVWLVTR